MKKRKLKKREEHYRRRFKVAVKHYQDLIREIKYILDKPKESYPSYYPKGLGKNSESIVLHPNREHEITWLLEEAVGWESGFDVYGMSIEEIDYKIRNPLKLDDL